MLWFGSGNFPKGPCIKGLISSLVPLGDGGNFKRWEAKGVSWPLGYALERDSETSPLIFLFCFLSMRWRLCSIMHSYHGVLPHCRPRSSRANGSEIDSSKPVLCICLYSSQVFVTVIKSRLRVHKHGPNDSWRPNLNPRPSSSKTHVGTTLHESCRCGAMVNRVDRGVRGFGFELSPPFPSCAILDWLLKGKEPVLLLL